MTAPGTFGEMKGRMVSLSPLRGKGACHPERRRREGPVFFRMRSLRAPIVLKQVLRSRASRALAQDDSAVHVRRNEREGGFSLSPLRGKRACHPERRRREGPALGGPGANVACSPERRRREGPVFFRMRRLRAPIVLKQVLRSRASRALAQDD